MSHRCAPSAAKARSATLPSGQREEEKHKKPQNMQEHNRSDFMKMDKDGRESQMGEQRVFNSEFV